MGQGTFVTNPDGTVVYLIDGVPVGSCKMASMGADVEANPAGAATDTLEKIEVDGTIYGIEGGIPIYDWGFNMGTTSPDEVLEYIKNQGLDFANSLPEVFVVKEEYTSGSLKMYISWMVFKHNKLDTPFGPDTVQSKFNYYIQSNVIYNGNGYRYFKYYSGDVVLYNNDTYSPSCTYTDLSACIKNNISANNWVSDNTYPEYPYKCEITCTGVNSSSVVQVIFSLEDSLSGNYAPICETGSGKVTIYSKVNTAITIPTIKEIV